MNIKILYSAGFIFLGLVMMFGAILAWNARWTLDQKLALRIEAERPAEIQLTLVTPTSCELCADGQRLVEAVEKLNVHVSSSASYVVDSEEGQSLIQSYGIGRAPALLIQGEYAKDNVRDELRSLGGEETSDTLVVEIAQPPYVDLVSQETIGLVNATYLIDSSCADCYDPTQHKDILVRSFGVVIQDERTVDARSTEGRLIVEQYQIAQTPTILLSSQATAYPRLSSVWQQVGSIEEDGTLVFRQNSVLGAVTYRDLKTGEIVQP